MNKPDSVAAEFGQRVKRWRTLRGWSMHELAAKAGVGAGLISALEAGKRDVMLSSAVRLATALEVPLSELAGVCLTCAGMPPAGFTCKDCGKG